MTSATQATLPLWWSRYGLALAEHGPDENGWLCVQPWAPGPGTYAGTSDVRADQYERAGHAAQVCRVRVCIGPRGPYLVQRVDSDIKPGMHVVFDRPISAAHTAVHGMHGVFGAGRVAGIGPRGPVLEQGKGSDCTPRVQAGDWATVWRWEYVPEREAE